MTCANRCRALPVLLLTLAATLAAGEQTARAGKVDDLSRALHSDPSFKVRVQAALLLGKLGDKAGVDPLIRALGDDNKAVRAMAAQSLGKLGDARATASLKAILTRERESFVRAQVQAALATLEEADSQGKKILVTVGPFTGGTKGADPAVLGRLRDSLKQSLSKLPQLAVIDGTSGLPKGRNRGPKLAFLVDGNVSRLDESATGANLETNCEVKVMVARWPSKSVILWTSAGAAVQGGRRDRDKQNARRDCIEASAGQLGDSLMSFFRSQGG